MKKIIAFLRRQSSLRYIALGFFLIIVLGSLLLMIPQFQKNPGTLKYIDLFYTSTSATCVTGLIALDVYDNFTIGGQIVVMCLIQIGGLGVTVLGTGLLVALKRRLSLKDRNIIQESLNVETPSEIYVIFRKVFIYTFTIEFLGACFSLISFARNYSIGDAIWKSIFHSVASFNNSGFDILGGGVNLQNYANDVNLNIVTSLLIILGGIGFIVIADVFRCKFNFKKLELHSKIVLFTTLCLLIVGTFAIKLGEMNNITWLGAFFTNVSTRTAGFSTFQIGKMRAATKFILIILMFIGASPCSTGGGIKTTTLFVLIKGIGTMVTHKTPKAFKYTISNGSIRKALSVLCLALTVVLLGTIGVCLFEMNNPHTNDGLNILFEVVSAYGTVGLSTGITPELTLGSKIICIIIMYLGRIGPLTFLSLWYAGKDENYRYPDGVISIG